MRGIVPTIPSTFDAPEFLGELISRALAAEVAGTATPFCQLNSLRLPARYIGGERHSILKDWDASRFRMALGFPDSYELGMSYLGMQILYAILNSPEQWTPARKPASNGPYLCERFFLPDDDYSARIISGEGELTTLESRRPLRGFDAVGISFTHERSFLNLPRILELAGIPVFQKNRPDDCPLVIGGGACMFNPEPVAQMLDVVAVGDGEELVLDIAQCLGELRGAPRSKRLAALAQIPGVYIPSLYEQAMLNGHFFVVAPKAGSEFGVCAPKLIRRRILSDFSDWPSPTKLVVPWVDTPGNWANVEIMRGCPMRCRFCHAGHVNLPVRSRKAQDVIASALSLLNHSGADQLSLQGLSVLDHPQITTILSCLRPILDRRAVSLSLPSLRMDEVSRQIARLMRRPKESSLTLAPEAGTPQLRDAINKRISSEDIRDTIGSACEAGWHKYKLYFMYGFPGETVSDVEAIVELCQEIRRIAKHHAPYPPRISVSANIFVPKPHTPLQWAPLEREADVYAKQQVLRKGFSKLGKNVQLSYTGYEEAFIEALLSRGDRRLCGVLAHACGVKHYQTSRYGVPFSALLSACEDAGIDAYAEVHRPREVGEPFPWDHIDTGVNRDYMEREWALYLEGKASPSCKDGCAVCGLSCS